MKRWIAAILLVGTAMISSTADAQVRVRRYYDRDSRDWHHWNQNEGRAYRAYMAERRARYREYVRLKRAEQRAYWRWRHAHSGVY